MFSATVFCLRFGLATGFLICASPSSAQNVFQADAQYQALTYTDANGYKGCGIRAIVLHNIGLPELVGADLSVNVWVRPSPTGIVKAAFVKAQPPSIKQIAPASFSMSTERDGVPLRMLGFQPGEDAGYIFSSTPETATAKLLMSMFQGERVVVGITEKKGGTERRFVFAAKLSPDDEKTFSACLNVIVNASSN